MAYLTELHAHTSEVSLCAKIDAAGVVDRYLKEGYTTLVIANHFNDYTIDPVSPDWQACATHYLNGWKKAVQHAAGRMNVLLGMEIRFPEAFNDYLIFGMTEEYLRSHPFLYRMSLKEFSAMAHSDGLLIVQAHPFRNGMKVVPPDLVDGYEVFNGHVGHDSRNPIALDWCRRYGKLPTSGSDFHGADFYVDAGILTNEPITDMPQLCRILQSRSYTLHCAGPLSEQEHMTDLAATAL